MKIAILGTRGVPASYGGFETFAQELSLQLVERGHDVTVYCRPGNLDSPVKGVWGRAYWRGVRLLVMPALRYKYLETVSHTFLSAIHAAFTRYDICLFCNAANAPFMIFPRLALKKTAINVDGIERARKKWNRAGKAWYRMGEYLSILLGHRVISDAQVIAKYYQETYGKRTDCIPYGASLERATTRGALDRFGLKPGEYLLYVSRLEPENNAHVVIKAFEQVETDKRLVIVGDAPYSQEYIASLHATSDRRVLFTGYVFGQGYRELQSHAYCYIHATEVGGTHPALIEGMALSESVIANDTPENAEVVARGGLLYRRNDSADLAVQMRLLLRQPEARVSLRQAAVARITAEYDWKQIANQYEALFMEMTEKKSRG